MTRRSVWWTLTLVTMVYAAAIGGAYAVRVIWHDGPEATPSWQYATYKGVLPLLVAIPAAWFAFVVQRRLSFLQQLRSLWTKLVEAFQSAVQYTHLEQPQLEQYAATLKQLSIVIDEFRSAYKNLREGDDDGVGFYPFESVKKIQTEIANLHPTKFSVAHATTVRTNILDQWKCLREPILSEFDREEPSLPDSPYIARSSA